MGGWSFKHERPTAVLLLITVRMYTSATNLLAWDSNPILPQRNRTLYPNPVCDNRLERMLSTWQADVLPLTPITQLYPPSLLSKSLRQYLPTFSNKWTYPIPLPVKCTNSQKQDSTIHKEAYVHSSRPIPMVNLQYQSHS